LLHVFTFVLTRSRIKNKAILRHFSVKPLSNAGHMPFVRQNGSI
jgi:hypothetical protein